MKLLIFLLLLSVSLSATEQEDIRSLNEALAKKEVYDAAKNARIDSLTDLLEISEIDKYPVYKQLYQENSSYKFSEAKRFADLMLQQATADGQSERIHEAQICRGFTYLSAGLFKEGYDLLIPLQIPPEEVENSHNYGDVLQRLLLDMSIYAETEESEVYGKMRVEVLQEGSCRLQDSQCYHYWDCKVNCLIIEGKTQEALEAAESQLKLPSLSKHQRAVVLSTKAYLHQELGDTAMMQHCNIMAAIADIESSTKETVALRRVAWRLYEEGEAELASKYIKIAMEDAQFYGAKQRMGEISQILPIIELSNQNRIERNRRHINRLTLITILLLTVCIVALFLLINRMKALHKARHIIERNNENLVIANRLKEECIANFLCWQSEFIVDVEKYEKQVIKRATEKRFEDLLVVPKNVDAHRRRDEFYQRFDEMFLSIFPTFVEDVNKMLRPGEQVVLKKGELLNSDLRIFALMRLGVSHNEVIAQMLDKSVTTVYTYKTKFKSRSDLSNEAFYKQLMAIPSFKEAQESV